MKQNTTLPGLLALCLFVFLSPTLFAQVNYTANDQVTPYGGKYRPGINMGWYPGWDNKSLADVAAGNPALGIPGIGSRSNRLGLQEQVLDYYGYGLVEGDFDHWESLGMGEFTAFLSGPTWAHQDHTQYCPGAFSALFANMYTPIWDGGANGTPYNDENYFAAYVWKTVNQYKDHVRFWEVWNEPGFDLTGQLGWRGPDYPGNWWLEGPNPCDNILHAPIYHYIRALRIAWEVIKTVDPDAYVCVSGVGFLSFLNAVLRNTDNPNMGDVSADFPLTGGAYFDAIAIHSYPHFDGSTIRPDLGWWQRHSDQAADGLMKVVSDYQGIFDQYGYDGVTFPKKEWIATEINSPRTVHTGPFFGGHDAQINHMMKVQMMAKINRVHQLHLFQLFDQKTQPVANYEFDLMGMYKNLQGAPKYNQQVNDLGKAMKTMTDMIFDTEYDAARTAALNLPTDVRGYAFKRTDGSFVYALWGRTTVDQSENVSTSYSFPAALNVQNLRRYEWDHGYTNAFTVVSPDNIALSARPSFFIADADASVPCQLTAAVSDVKCNASESPSDPSDDVFTATLVVTGTSASGAWKATINGVAVNGSLGVPVTVGPFPIAGGNAAFTVEDADDAGCSADVVVAAPAPCSSGQGPCASQSDFPWHDWIARVQLGTLDHSSNKSAYSDFSNYTVTLAPGNPTDLTLTAGFSWETFDEYWKVWIDYNQNGAFEEPFELAFSGMKPKPANGTATSALTGFVSVPANATAGLTRMRISMTRGGFPDPCDVLDYGEVEEYGVKIVTQAVGNRGIQSQNGRLVLYPNPTTGQVIVDLQAYTGQIGRLTVYSAAGQRVRDLAVGQDTPPQLLLDLAGLGRGMYLVRVEADGQVDEAWVVVE